MQAGCVQHRMHAHALVWSRLFTHIGRSMGYFLYTLAMVLLVPAVYFSTRRVPIPLGDELVRESLSTVHGRLLLLLSEASCACITAYKMRGRAWFCWNSCGGVVRSQFGFELSVSWLSHFLRHLRATTTSSTFPDFVTLLPTRPIPSKSLYWGTYVLNACFTCIFCSLHVLRSCSPYGWIDSLAQS